VGRELCKLNGFGVVGKASGRGREINLRAERIGLGVGRVGLG
jgi:hypothetical protein